MFNEKENKTAKNKKINIWKNLLRLFHLSASYLSFYFSSHRKKMNSSLIPPNPFSRIGFLLVPKIGSCEQIENDLLTHGSVILKKNGWKKNALYFHPTLFLKYERHRQILPDIPVIVLAPNWRFFVSSENRIVWTQWEWPSDILTTKNEPRNRTVWTPASNFETKNRIRKIGSCERALILLLNNSS